jgi:hypothetical protein
MLAYIFVQAGQFLKQHLILPQPSFPGMAFVQVAAAPVAVAQVAFVLRAAPRLPDWL